MTVSTLSRSLCLQAPFLALLVGSSAAGRQVVNGDFETGTPPTAISQIGNAPPWQNANLSSTDYFSAAGAPPASVPTNFFGSRTARSGSAYAGIHTYGMSPSDPNYLFREYLQGALSAPLDAGTTYLVSFWTCRADGFQGVLAANNLGVKLSPTSLLESHFVNLSVTADHEYPFVISDSTSWQRISFPHLANGTEAHLVIGNFNDNAGTTVQVLGSTVTGARAYYYIDDVSIDECSEVVNGDFETGTIPSGLSQIGNAAGWQDANLASTDYFAVGGGAGADVPDNHFGSRTPRSGNAYAGIHTYALSPSDPDYLFREYLQTQLSAPLSAGTTYLIEFWASRADGPIALLATDKLGVKLSVTSLLQNDVLDLAVTPDHESQGVLVDSVSWTRISFLHTSVAGGEQHLVIGNFNDNAGTTVQTLGSAPNAVAYYYIDDVSVRCIGDVRATTEACSVPDALNVDVLSAAPAVIGQDWSASVALGHAHGGGGGVMLKMKTTCCNGPIVVSPLGGRQTRVLICGPTLALVPGSHDGTTGTVGPLPVPLDLSLVGFEWAAQATVIGGGFADLSTAVSGVVGTY